MFSSEKEALLTIAAALRKKYPGRIPALYAFGSRVRGDHSETSDFDVLVVVAMRTPEMEEGIIDIFVQTELKTGFFFDPVIKTLESFKLEEKYNTPFFENIEKEGIAL